MFRAIGSVAAMLAAFVVLAACSSPPGKIVTSSQDQVVVSISKRDAQNLDTALASAGKLATKECRKSGKTAKLNRSEDAAEGVIAYFDCVAPAESSG